MSKFRNDFLKYLAFIYPYLSIIFYEIIMYFFENFCQFKLSTDVKQSIFIIINASSLLWGFSVIKNYTHKNTTNYERN